ncbi:MAG TPA: hypothetical protein VFX45_12215 [Solirubrobacterales bacterium]|nr:hypothetical protein [Solirubrobacterales bacterium]
MNKLIAGGLTAALGMLLFASTALASSHNPTGEYAQFAECPMNRATINDCVYSVTTGGSVTLGNKTVPLKNPATLQGGFEGEGSGIKFYGAENGDTLSKTPQPVPGGLVGVTAPTWWPKFLQDWFNGLIEEGFTGVDATVELMGPTKGLTNIKLNTENLLERTGTALGLPVRVHLENVILGNSCYIGSSTKPVQIDLTTGTSGGLEGSVGAISFNPAFTIVTVAGSELVNNTFSAPAASGCGGLFSLFVDPLVNSIIGLPAGEGENSATLEADFQDALAEYVKLSE